MREQIKRAGGGAHLGGGNAQIAGGGSQAAMAEQKLDSTDVGALLEKVNGKCVPQGMRRDGFGNLASGVPFGIHAQLRSGDVPVREIAGEEPVLGSFQAPPVTQSDQQLRREHHVAIFFPFSLFDAQDHALAVDRWRREDNGFGDAQASGIAGGQNRAMLGTGNGPRNWMTSSGLRIIGSRCGFLGAGMTSSKTQFFLRVIRRESEERQ